jgi:hypothetical protein
MISKELPDHLHLLFRDAFFEAPDARFKVCCLELRRLGHAQLLHQDILRGRHRQRAGTRFLG